ncbi:MAG: hypothetical protein ACKVU4_11775 [Phycisphaerales bacterium]
MKRQIVVGVFAACGAASVAAGQAADLAWGISDPRARVYIPGPAQPPVNWNHNPTDAVLWDNGPFVTGPAAAGGCVGSQSLLQNPSMCLNTFGYTASAAFNLADDFTLTSASTVSSITVYAYQTTATAPSITGGTMRIHTSQPVLPTDPAIATTSTVAPVTMSGVFRQSEITIPCTRQIQIVKFTFAPAVNLPAGTYWISWLLTGNAALTGPFTPPVSIIGQFGKPGANAQQSNPGFIPVVDAGVLGCIPAAPNPPVPVPNPQDFPFVVEGSAACYPDCNNSGSLTVADFGCFQGKYVLGDMYADCNASGTLTVADFGCFQGKYVLGCTP